MPEGRKETQAGPGRQTPVCARGLHNRCIPNPAHAFWTLEIPEPLSHLLTTGPAAPMLPGQTQPASAPANVPNQMCSHPNHQTVVGHILHHNRSGANHGKASDRDVRENGHPGADRGSITDTNLAGFPVALVLQPPTRHDRPWNSIVRKTGVRSDEHTVFERRFPVDEAPILDFAIGSDTYIAVDVRSLSNNRVGADASSLSDLHVVPQLHTGTEVSVWRNFGS